MPIATGRNPITGMRLVRNVSNPVPTPKTAPALKQRVHLLDVPFEMRGVAQAAKASWNAAAKAFSFVGDALPEALAPFAARPYSWEAYREDEINGVVRPEALPSKVITLRPHQGTAVTAIRGAHEEERPGFLLADDVGLGKTIEAWKAVLEMEDVETVLIVCPLAVVAHWRRTIQFMGDKGRRIVVINYDRLAKLFEVPATIPTKSRKKSVKKRKVRTKKGVAAYGAALGFDVIVFDECHKGKNPTSARSKLMAKLSDEAGFLLWLSATAGQNPAELSYLAPILAEGEKVKASDADAWIAWCTRKGMAVRSSFGAPSWLGNSKIEAERAKADGDLDIIHSLLFGGAKPLALRRTPEDIEGWPSIDRIMLPVALEGEDRILYAKAWAEFRDAVGLDRTGAADTQAVLVARLRFRQKASLLRTGATVDLALDMLEQGRQVAISVNFRETMDIIVTALENSGHRVAVIHGDLNATQKEEQRLDFQYGRATVVVYTVEDGISLHQDEYEDSSSAPRVNLIHDLRWSAISTKQIEGRTHRDSRFSQIYWMLGEGTVEEDLAEVLLTKMRAMSKMQGDHGTAAEMDRLLDQAAQSGRMALAA